MDQSSLVSTKDTTTKGDPKDCIKLGVQSEFKIMYYIKKRNTV